MRRGVAGHEDGGGGEDGGVLHFAVRLVGGGFLITCGRFFLGAFLWGLMEEERGGWLSANIYVARGSFARGALTIRHHHIELSAQSSIMTPSYFGDYKDVAA